MKHLSPSQKKVLNFIVSRWENGEALPSCREIMKRFRWTSPKAATDVIGALKTKGFLESDAQTSRKYRLAAQAVGLRVAGEIPAGFPVDATEQTDHFFTLNPASFGVSDRSAAFLLKVRGDSMIGRKIFDGDMVLVERFREPRHLDIVAALIDQQSTLKTLVKKENTCWLHSENSDYPDIHPLEELQIQGVACGVIRTL